MLKEKNGFDDSLAAFENRKAEINHNFSIPLKYHRCIVVKYCSGYHPFSTHIFYVPTLCTDI